MCLGENGCELISMGIIDEKWELTDRDPSQPEWEAVENKELEARRMEIYAAQIDRMDRGIGQLIKTLKAYGQLENTMILFLSDNGGCAEKLEEDSETWLIKDLLATKTTWDGKEVKFGNDPSILTGGEETYQSYGVAWANLSNTPFRLYKHWVHEGGISTPLLFTGRIG